MIGIGSSIVNFQIRKKVPNIRFNVAKCLQMLAPVCGKDVCGSQIRPVLSLLVEDPDRDVRFYANRTLDSIKTI